MTEIDIMKLADEICYQSRPFTSVDINDVNRITKDREHVDGFQIVCTYETYEATLQSIQELTAKENLTLEGLLVYIDTAESDEMAVQGERINAILTHIGLHEIPDNVYIIPGAGANKDIQPGHFRLIMLAAYRKIESFIECQMTEEEIAEFNE